jgi:hypothetical protein
MGCRRRRTPQNVSPRRLVFCLPPLAAFLDESPDIRLAGKYAYAAANRSRRGAGPDVLYRGARQFARVILGARILSMDDREAI